MDFSFLWIFLPLLALLFLILVVSLLIKSFTLPPDYCERELSRELMQKKRERGMLGDKSKKKYKR